MKSAHYFLRRALPIGCLVIGISFNPANRADVPNDETETFTKRLNHDDRYDGLHSILRQDPYKRIDAVLILNRGSLVFEEYFNGYARDQLYDFASVTKSVSSLLCGIAIDKGLIEGVDSPVYSFYEGTRYFEAWDEEKRAITIGDLLTMRHGLDCDDYSDPGMGRFNKWLREKDPLLSALKIPMRGKPGEASAYCTASTQLLRIPMEKTSGLNFEEFSEEALFRPLGISTFQWAKTPTGKPALGYGGKSRPLDIARIGLMIENHGLWEGKRIVSERWLEQSFAKHGTLLGIDYGYLWYREDYTIEGKRIRSNLAMGHGGQFLIMFPELKSILVIAASDYDGKIDFYGFIATEILPLIRR